MILYPSLHIENGKVARLTRSRNTAREIDIIHPDPMARAKNLVEVGFPWLHIVDLDAAFDKPGTNKECIKEILQEVNIPIQLSGGIRSIAIIEEWLNLGVECVVMTSAAQQDPTLVHEAVSLFPGRIAVKIDAIDGYVARNGWNGTTSLKALDLALQVEEAGVAKIIYADINRDGALSEIDIESVVDLAFALTVPVVAAGGIHSLKELISIKSHGKDGLQGVILGRCIYDGDIDPKEALAIAGA